MSEKIKPCPLCDGAGEAIRWQRDGAAFAVVKCANGCRMYGPEVRVVAGKMEEAIRQAVGLWNRRPREDRLACLLGEAMACTISADLAARIDAALKEET